MSFGTRLQQLLNQEAMTQVEFADKISMTSNALNRVICGKREPSFQTIAAIARELPRVDMRWLITGINQT